MTEEKKPEEIVAVPEEDRKTFQRGVQLFVVYIFFYTLFTIAGTVRKEILMIRIWGMNLGIVGFHYLYLNLMNKHLRKK